MNELKPCPFCGGKAWMLEDIWGAEVYYRAACEHCYCGTAHEETEIEVITAWNKRVKED